ETCLDSPPVTKLVHQGLLSGRAAEACACCAILEKLRGPPSASLLALLSSR
ncbi:unnamed protein product, partial [Polarella glacialis]